MTPNVVKCINELRDEFEELKKDSVNPIVINNDWNKLVEPIKLIIVGDNPGEKEKKCGVYFHRDGQAGSRARKFAREYLNINEKDKLHNVVFMNKCPIYSKDTSSLEVSDDPESDFRKSLCLTVSAFEKLSENKDLPILITGISSNKLNRRFYKELFQIEKWEEKFLFSKHFSYNNFDNQWNECKMNPNEEKLKCISNQTIEVLKQRFSSKLKQPICKEIIQKTTLRHPLT